jgi:glycosyltransferase involved in cell wall biosynthesis
MPVHDAAAHLDASLASVLAQTWRDFELVALDDGSRDDSPAILRAWAARDERVRVVTLAARLGLAASADRVVREARAPICARMDADDVCHPDRLRRQWAALDGDPGAVLVGTLWEGIDATGRLVRPRDRWRLVRRSAFAPFPHGSIMFRRAAFEAAGGYRAPCEHWEDIDLYHRLAPLGRLLVVPEVLYRYRFHIESATLRDSALDALARMDAWLAAREAGQDAEQVLKRSGEAPVGPRALRHATAPALWAGRAPGILGRLARLDRWGPPRALAEVLVLGVTGALAPRAVRALLGAVIRGRDHLAGRRLAGAEVVEWRFR